MILIPSLTVTPDQSSLRFENGQTVTANTSLLSKVFLKVDRAPVGLMPPAIRWISDDSCTYLMERPPSYITITHTPVRASLAAQSSAAETFCIATPWLSYLIRFSNNSLSAVTSLDLYAHQDPIRTLDDVLCYFPLPNLMEGGYGTPQLCLGHSFNANYKKDQAQLKSNGEWDAAQFLTMVINLMWQSGFNNDISLSNGWYPTSYKRHGPNVCEPKSWLIYLSKLSLSEVLTLDFVKYKTVAAIISQANQTPNKGMVGFLSELFTKAGGNLSA